MDKKLNILFLTHRFSPFTGGIEVNSEILATQFQNAGHNLKLMTWTKELGSKTFPFEVIRDPSLLKLIKGHLWADVVYENNPCYRLSWPLLLINSVSVIAIRTLIERSDGQKAWQDRIKFKHLKRANRVIAVSSPIREVSWPRAIVIPNPFRASLFRKLEGFQRNLDFVFLGRLVSQKRCDLNIELIARLKKTHPTKANLTIVGDGPEMEPLKKMVDEKGLSENIKFAGELRGQSLVEELNKYQYQLIPSDFEAFGNVALEGLACGLLPIVSNSGGLVDAVGQAGVCFESSNIDSFYKETIRLLENPQAESKLRSLAESHLSNHEPEKIGRRYLDEIESAYAKARHRTFRKTQSA